MPGVPRARTTLLLLGLVAAGIAATALSGCALKHSGDTEKGRMLFTSKCGVCHTLTQAGTTAQVGPDLDAAFKQARAQGMDSDTIHGIVAAPLPHPRYTHPD